MKGGILNGAMNKMIFLPRNENISYGCLRQWNDGSGFLVIIDDALRDENLIVHDMDNVEVLRDGMRASYTWSSILRLTKSVDDII